MRPRKSIPSLSPREVWVNEEKRLSLIEYLADYKVLEYEVESLRKDDVIIYCSMFRKLDKVIVSTDGHIYLTYGEREIKKPFGSTVQVVIKSTIVS